MLQAPRNHTAVWSPRSLVCTNTVNEPKVIKRIRAPLLLYFENKKEDAGPYDTYCNPISCLLSSPDPAATLDPPQLQQIHTHRHTHTHVNAPYPSSMHPCTQPCNVLRMELSGLLPPHTECVKRLSQLSLSHSLSHRALLQRVWRGRSRGSPPRILPSRLGKKMNLRPLPSSFLPLHEPLLQAGEKSCVVSCLKTELSDQYLQIRKLKLCLFLPV